MFTCHVAHDFKKHNQLLKLIQFLLGLDDAYLQITSNILSRDPLHDVKGVYAISVKSQTGMLLLLVEIIILLLLLKILTKEMC